MVKPQHLVIGRRAEQRARGPERYSPHRRGGAKSFVDDLVLGRGVVLSRAATSLRSIESKERGLLGWLFIYLFIVCLFHLPELVGCGCTLDTLHKAEEPSARSGCRTWHSSHLTAIY